MHVTLVRYRLNNFRTLLQNGSRSRILWGQCKYLPRTNLLALSRWMDRVASLQIDANNCSLRHPTRGNLLSVICQISISSSPNLDSTIYLMFGSPISRIVYGQSQMKQGLGLQFGFVLGVVVLENAVLRRFNTANSLRQVKNLPNDPNWPHREMNSEISMISGGQENPIQTFVFPYIINLATIQSAQSPLSWQNIEIFVI
jgi:hypothetical protein